MVAITPVHQGLSDGMLELIEANADQAGMIGHFQPCPTRARLGEHIFFSLLNKRLVNYGNHRTCFRMINRTAAVTRIGRGIELKEVIDLPSV